MLANEYGKDDAIHTLCDALKQAGVEHIEPIHVTLLSYQNDVKSAHQLLKYGRSKVDQDGIKHESHDADPHAGEDLVVFNLCDGTEEDGYPVCIFYS